ncbi:MAG TPA: hypothetical protein VF119_11550 [Candidatus Limnocylindrales bacterium]
MGTLVLLDTGVCPSCRARTDDEVIDHPALLRHGGYGATTRQVYRHCGHCGWACLVERSEVSPR